MSFGGSLTGTLGLNISGFMAGTAQARSALSGLTTQMRAAAATNTMMGNSLASTSLRLGAQLTTVTAGFAALSGAIGFAVKNAAEFEESFASIRKVLQDTSEEGFSKLKRDLIELTETLPIASTELFKIAQVASQLGLTAQQIPDFAKIVGQLLTVQGGGNAEKIATDLAKFADITGTAYTQVDRLANSLVDLANKTTATESNILSLSFRLAPIASKAGATSAEIMALSASLIGSGLQLEVAGTAVGRFIESINNAVASGNEHLGIFAALTNKSARDFESSWKTNMMSTLLDVVEGFSNFTKSGGDVAEILRALRIDGFRVNLVLDAMNERMGKFRETTGNANKALNTTDVLMKAVSEKTSTLNSQWEIFKNNARQLGENLGQYLIPPLKETLGLLSSVIGSMNIAMTKTPQQQQALQMQTQLQSLLDLRNRINSGTVTEQDKIDRAGSVFFNNGTMTDVFKLNKMIKELQMKATVEGMKANSNDLITFGKDLFSRGYEALSNKAKEEAANASKVASSEFKSGVENAMAEAKSSTSRMKTELEKSIDRGNKLFNDVTPGMDVVNDIIQGLKDMAAAGHSTQEDMQNLVDTVMRRNSKQFMGADKDDWLTATVEKLKQMGELGQNAIGVISSMMETAMEKEKSGVPGSGLLGPDIETGLIELLRYIDPVGAALKSLSIDMETLQKYGMVDDTTTSLLSTRYLSELSNVSQSEYARIEAALVKLGLTGEKLKAQLDLKKVIANLGEVTKIGGAIAKVGNQISSLGNSMKSKFLNVLGTVVNTIGNIVSSLGDVMSAFKSAKEVGKTAFEALSLTIQGALGVIGMVLAAIQAVLSVMGMFSKETKELTGVAKVIDDIKKASDQWVSDFADQILNLTKTGKANFHDMFQSILDDMFKIGVTELIAGPAMKFIGNFLGLAKGGRISDGVAYAAKGVVMNSPTFIRTKSGPNVIASEFGQEEYVMPAKRGKDGVLGVRGHITSSPTIINLHDHRQAGQKIEVKESSNEDGIKQFDIIVRDSFIRNLHGRQFDMDLSTFGMRRLPS